jgi:hypothetical protein
MKKTSLLLTLGLALMLASAATPKANAGVVVAVGVGAPVYVRPVRPYPYVVPAPYVAPVPYTAYVPAAVYRRVYVAPARVYYRNWYPRRYVVRRDFHRDWR